MAWWKKYVYRNELDGTGGDTGGGDAGGGFDMAGAVETLSADIFGTEEYTDGKPKDEGLGDGETVNEEIKEPPKPTPAPTAAPVAPPAATPAPTAAPAPGTPSRFTADAIPSTWSPALSAKWATVDPEIRAEIAKRENDMFTGLEQYKEGAALAREIKTVLRPMEHLLTQHNVAPHQFVHNMVQSHMMLSDTRLSNEQRFELAAHLMKAYGIDLKAGVKPAGGQATVDEPYVDPEVQRLHTRVETLESERQAEARRAAEAQRQERAAAIEAFAKDPAHPHFDDVIDDMTLLIRGSGGKMELQDAYERACYANPVVRAKMVAEAEAAAIAKAQKEAQDRAAAARQATATNVKTSGHQGRGTAPAESMEDTMKETLAAINKRDRK